MMGPNKDQLPRVFQANLSRLLDRVILPVMEGLPHHAELVSGQATTLAQFLDRAAAQVDNYTASETAKAFTLALAGVFERQLSIWGRAIHEAGLADIAGLRGFEALLGACAEHAGIDLAGGRLGADLRQMFIVANVVRHGEGQSCEKLGDLAPELWDIASPDYFDLLPGPAIASEHLRIRKRDLARYIRATTRFWGLADPLPLAVTNSPYWNE